LFLLRLVSLRLSADHLNAMRSHAEQAYPDECCGLLIGRSDQRTGHLIAVQSVVNDWNPHLAQTLGDEATFGKTRRYGINPQDMLKGMQTARSRGLDIIGIYHSHPDHAAIPSECDRRLAWPQYFYIILSVHQGHVQDIQNWQLDTSHQFQPKPISLTSTPTPY